MGTTTSATILFRIRDNGRLVEGRVQGFSHDEQVADLAKESSVGTGAANLLRLVGAVHGATDSALWEKAGLGGGYVAKKGVIEITETRRQVFFSLGSQKHEKAAAGLEECGKRFWSVDGGR